MSQHILAHATKPNAHFVVGYDRPLHAYFLQVWDMNVDENMPIYVDDCFEIDFLPNIGAVLPDGLHATLIKECLGQINPNYVKDYRESSSSTTR